MQELESIDEKQLLESRPDFLSESNEQHQILIVLMVTYALDRAHVLLIFRLQWDITNTHTLFAISWVHVYTTLTDWTNGVGWVFILVTFWESSYIWSMVNHQQKC